MGQTTYSTVHVSWYSSGFQYDRETFCMQHTRVIEEHAEATLQDVHQMSTFDALVTRSRDWMATGGVGMTDEELRGALTALGMVYLRSSTWDMPVSIFQMIGEIGATVLGINRSREMSEAERMQMEALFASLEGRPNIPDEGAGVDAILAELVGRARTAMANDDLPLADSYLSAILRRAEQMQEAISC